VWFTVGVEVLHGAIAVGVGWLIWELTRQRK
jgi:hypothetical protein